MGRAMLSIDAVKEELKSFLIKQFPSARNQHFNNNEQLLASGIVDSLGVLDLVNYIEQTFQISMSDEDLVPENFQTIEKLTLFIRNKMIDNSKSRIGQ